MRERERERHRGEVDLWKYLPENCDHLKLVIIFNGSLQEEILVYGASDISVSLEAEVSTGDSMRGHVMRPNERLTRPRFEHEMQTSEHGKSLGD